MRATYNMFNFLVAIFLIFLVINFNIAYLKYYLNMYPNNCEIIIYIFQGKYLESRLFFILIANLNWDTKVSVSWAILKFHKVYDWKVDSHTLLALHAFETFPVAKLPVSKLKL